MGGSVRYFSAQARLLPFLEQSALFDAINFQVELTLLPGTIPPNVTIYETSLSVFLCPSDGLATGKRNSYRGNIGVGPAPGTNAESHDSGNGFVQIWSLSTAASFPDGLSHTVAYSERLCGSGDDSRKVPERDVGDLDPYPYAVIRDADYALGWCRVAARERFPRSVELGWTWMIAFQPHTTYCHAQEPNGPIPDGISFGYNPGWGIVTARSWHHGGVNALMGDGSLRFVTEQIERRVWRGLGTRSGGELVE